MPPAVRPIARDDKPAWLGLWRGYLAFYRSDLPDAVTDVTFERFLDPAEPVHALIAEADGAMVGFASYLFHRSTWSVSTYCYLEDLFTDPAARGRGAAGALIEAVADAAAGAGASKLYWQTHEANARARALYDRLAANEGFIVYARNLGAR